MPAASSSASAGAAVLFVDHATSLGGGQHVLLNLLRAIDRSWLVPHVATPPGALADGVRALGVAVHELPMPPLRHPLGLWRLGRGASALRRLIDGEGIALVHANTMRASLYASAAVRRRRCAFVWHVHDIFEPGWYLRYMCGRADAAVAVSAAAAAPLPCAAKVRVVHNGVAPERFCVERSAEAVRLRERWGVPPSATLVGQVARLTPWKGQRDVLAVADRLQRERDDVYVVIVGGDVFGDAADYAAELEAAVRARGMGARLLLAGHRDDIPTVLSAVDIVVHASDREPFGMVLIEAGAAARPVVAYAGGGVDEIVSHERTGMLVQSKHPSALADAIERLIDDPTLARSLGENARDEVCGRFDVRAQARGIEVVYREVLDASLRRAVARV